MASLNHVRPIVFCGPSGAGKSTLLKRLLNEHPNTFAFSVSHTTRPPRTGEQDGREYHFVSHEDMIKLVEENQFLEHAQFSGNMYGTSKEAVQDVLASGRICILDVDIQGVKNLKETDLNPLYLFIQPPSLGELEKRLRGRGTETEESLQRRLVEAKKLELDYGKDEKNAFDHVIVNDNLDRAYESLEAILNDQIKAIVSIV